MSSKPETTFTASVHRHLPRSLHVEKMNNPYRGGTADVWYSSKKDIWVEYKFEVLPKRDNTIVPIDTSELQKGWLNGRYSEGRAVFVVVGCKEGGVIFADLAWNSPLNKQQFLERLMTRQQIALWIMERTGGPP